MMFRKYLDCGNTIVACIVLIAGCGLSVISWKIDSSGIFSALYILLGITGFLFIFLLKPKQMRHKKENALLRPTKFKHIEKKDSENSGKKFKALATTLLNTTDIMTKKQFDECFQDGNIDSDLLPKEQVDYMNLLQVTNVTEKLTDSILENISNNNQQQDRTLLEINHCKLDAMDIVKGKYNTVFPHKCQRSNRKEKSLVEEAVPDDLKRSPYFEDFAAIAKTNVEKFKHNTELHSSNQNSANTDNLCVVKPLAAIQNYPKKCFANENQANNVMETESHTLERKLSSEPVCFSCLW